MCFSCARSGCTPPPTSASCAMFTPSLCIPDTMAFFQFLGSAEPRCPLPGKYFPPTSPNSSSSSFRSRLTYCFLQEGFLDFFDQVSASIIDSPGLMWLCLEVLITIVILHFCDYFIFSLTRWYASWQQEPCMLLLIMISYSSIELMNGWLSLILRKTRAVDNLNSIF